MDASSKPFLVALDLERKEEGLYAVKRSRRISRKSRNLLEGSRRNRNVVTKRVRILRKLVQSTEPASLDGLFKDTADYIVALQLRVKLMQDLVDMLGGSGE